MISTSALCFALAMSYTSANTASKAKVDELMGKISSEVVGDLVQVANAANATNTSAVQLNVKLEDTALFAFERMEPEMKELLSLSGNSTDQLADSLGHMIDQDKDLRNALCSDDTIAPRGIGIMFVKAAKFGLGMLEQYLQAEEKEPVS